jgi:hypothetical protein
VDSNAASRAEVWLTKMIIDDCAVVTAGAGYGCTLFGLEPGFDCTAERVR